MMVLEMWELQECNNVYNLGQVEQKLYYDHRKLRMASPTLLPCSVQMIAETQPI